MDLRAKQKAVVDALEDIKGHDIVVYNTAALPTMFERVVIASGDSNRQVKALADHVQDKLTALGARVYGVEGTKTSEWVLVDFGDMVVHVMHPTVRSFYNLEEIWGGKELKLKPPPAKKPVAKKRAPAKKKRGKAPRRRARR
ncbi:MAG TPA: ribosome silencing factor [Burkholderiales bacterium]|nr:ribosome silencing factor [Burkholderiales bacterium]HXJ08255.1 ribosome silencing factor [Burkholderiales bacterium]